MLTWMRDKSNRTEENIVGRTKRERTDRISEHLSCLCINAKGMRRYLAELEVLNKQDQNYESTIIETWWEYSHGWNI